MSDTITIDREGIAASRWADHLWQPKLVQLDDGRCYVEVLSVGELITHPLIDEDQSYHFPQDNFRDDELIELLGFYVMSESHKNCEWLEGQDCWMAFI